jgi:hypothetical protein
MVPHLAFLPSEPVSVADMRMTFRRRKIFPALSVRSKLQNWLKKCRRIRVTLLRGEGRLMSRPSESGGDQEDRREIKLTVLRAVTNVGGRMQ